MEGFEEIYCYKCTELIGYTKEQGLVDCLCIECMEEKKNG